MSHKSGFVNILGNPNVGKSTIMNALVGEKLSIISPKAQTTRHRIMGIVNGEDFQIVYSDTPGILRPRYKLQETMMNSVNSALSDADLLLYITDVSEHAADQGEYIDKIRASGVPVIIAVNKIDLTNQGDLEKIVESWHLAFPQSPQS
jgi:GTP-binding protein Era